jgi:hypothetical protein
VWHLQPGHSRRQLSVKSAVQVCHGVFGRGAWVRGWGCWGGEGVCDLQQSRGIPQGSLASTLLCRCVVMSCVWAVVFGLVGSRRYETCLDRSEGSAAEQGHSTGQPGLTCCAGELLGQMPCSYGLL